MAQGFDQLVSKLQVRFDYQSSRIMTREALSRAGLKEQDHYSNDELQKFADGLASVAKNLDRVWTSLGIAPSGQPLPPPPAPKVEAKPAPEPPKPAPAPEPAPAPVVEAAPEPEPQPEPVVEAAPEPQPEPVVEAASETEQAASAEEPAADSWFNNKKNKKNKNRNRDGEAQSDTASEGETPAE